MIVKNEYVKIKSGKTEYTLRNYLYDKYLKLWSEEQYKTKNIYCDNRELLMCYIKFDTPLTDYKNAEKTDFDIGIHLKTENQVGSGNKVEITYEYTSLGGVFDASDEWFIDGVDLSLYDGKKITAIGFGSDIEEGGNYQLCACIDTSNYSMTLDATRGIYISRKDIISSNAICDGYEFPLHLAPKTNYIKNNMSVKAVLYSVGFGNSRGKMSQEFVIGKDAEVKIIDDFSYGIIMKNPISVALYPQTKIQPLANRYPIQPEYKATIYPQEKRYASNNMYPTKAGYNYIIFKYRLYYYDINDYYNQKLVYLDEYYTMSYAHNPKGLFTIKNKIERG